MQVEVNNEGIMFNVYGTRYFRRIMQTIRKLYIIGVYNSMKQTLFYESDQFQEFKFTFFTDELCAIFVSEMYKTVHVVVLRNGEEIMLREFSLSEEIEKIIIPYALEGYEIYALGW